MKLFFAKSIGRLATRSLSFMFLSGVMLSPLLAEATQSLYSNNGTVSSPINIDATNFLNTGTFSWGVATATPYQTAHTLNYTNMSGGTMSGGVGWEFDDGPLSSGGRGWSTSFFNDNNCTVSALDGIIEPQNGIDYAVSYLLVSATNIVNKGSLSAGPNGEIILNGSQVTLDRSLLDITPVVAIYNEFWSAGTNVQTFKNSLWDGTNVSAETFFNDVGEACGTTTETIGPLTPQVTDSYSTNVNPYQLTLTNSVGATSNITVYSNMVKQAVFVLINTNVNITATNHFSPSSNPTNFFKTVAVQFNVPFTNFATLASQTNTLYVVDDLASSTNRLLNTNTVIYLSDACTGPTTQPTSVIVSSTDPGSFANGFSGMGKPSSTYFYEPFTSAGLPAGEISEMYSNVVATGVAEAYSALVDDLAAEPPFGFSITNAPGKIYVYANALDLTKTRMSALSQIVIQATNLIGSAGAAMDCQNLSYNLGSTNGFLNITNLAASEVKRFNGTVTEWSGLWTNHLLTVYPNYMQVITPTSTNNVFSPLTNETEVDLSITVVDASGLSSSLPVMVQDLVLNSSNIVVSDSMDVTNTLLLKGQSFTLLGSLTLSTGVQNWGAAIAPTLRYFTNDGTLIIPNNAHFGDDGPTNYAVFVNQGFIFSGGQTINSSYLDINAGTDVAEFGDFTATCQTGLVMNATIQAAGDIQFFANNLQIDPSIVTAGGAIDFTVTNSLSDAGYTTGNKFVCQNGFNLFIKPTTGDLLGTTITNMAFDQDDVDSIWAGHDLGASTAGYTNNVALRDLVLLPQGSSLLEPLFQFTGATSGNGMYVSNLDLSALTDYANEIQIDPNLNIYFAAAELPPSVITGHPATEEFLNGKFGGHLIWAGVTTLVKQPVISGGMMPGGKFQIDANTPSGQTNIIQASTNLVNWISIYTNIGSSPFIDPTATNYHYRFYRVVGP